MDTGYAQQFKKGSLEMVLLCLIASRETYGYEIITSLNKMGGAIFGYTREGTVYPILYRLEKNGMIQSRLVPAPANGGTKKFYSLTKKGAELLSGMTQYWQEYVACVNTFVSLPKVEGAE